MHWLAVLVGGLGVAFPAYAFLYDFYPRGIFALPVLMVAVGYFIRRGRDMAWVRSWGCLAATALLCSTLLFYISVSVNRLPAKDIGEAFVLLALTATFAILGAMFFGACLLFLLLAAWQCKRMKRGRVKQSFSGTGESLKQ